MIGYDEVVQVDSNQAEYVAPLTIEALREATAEPWFMSVGFFETHRDFFAPTSVRDTLYSLPPANLPDVLATRRDFAAFKASARSLDQGIGAVLHALHDLGLVENTLVLCTTDHGVAFPGAKATLFDRGIGVMMIMRGPGGFTGGKVVDAAGQPPRRLPDPLRAGRGRAARLAAGQLADAAGPRRGRAPARGDLRRDDLPRRLPAPARRPHRALEVHPPLRRLRRTRCSPTATTAASKDLWVEAGWGERIVPREQLYDLVLDPAEGDNLAADPARAEALAEMRGRLDAWMRETDDPLLDGPVAPPPGAIGQRAVAGLARTSRRDRHGRSHGRCIQLRQVQPEPSAPPGSRASLPLCGPNCTPTEMTLAQARSGEGARRPPAQSGWRAPSPHANRTPTPAPGRRRRRR